VTRAAETWAEALAAWAIPPDILAEAPEDPWAYPVGHFIRAAEESLVRDTPSLHRALEALPVGGKVLDVGCGAGAASLPLAAHASVLVGVDESEGMLAVARSVVPRARVVRARLEDPLPVGPFDLVVSNPPYVANVEAATLPASVRDWEPPIALFSSRDGMSATQSIIREAAAVLEPGGLLALEIDSRRAALAAEFALADGHYHDVSVRLDLAGRERILLARRNPR
jgi:release factor glutamine methyltransferase